MILLLQEVSMLFEHHKKITRLYEKAFLEALLFIIYAGGRVIMSYDLMLSTIKMANWNLQWRYVYNYNPEVKKNVDSTCVYLLT